MPAGLAPISYASTIVGFVSFAITLLTLAGVYGDLISTLRKAPTLIPIVLGNLRQELVSERDQLRRKIRCCRDPHHIKIGVKGLSTRRLLRNNEEVLYLLQRTIKDLWVEFKNLERPFLVRSGRRAEKISRGDYWGKGDLEGGDQDEEGEKGGGVGFEIDERVGGKQKIGTDGASYYRTDLSHRFIWWQCKDDVVKLADQVQRVQIRRIERDVFETGELARRCLGLLSGGNADDAGGDGGSGSGSDSDSGGRGMRRRRGEGGGGGGGGGGSGIVPPAVAVSRPRSRASARTKTKSRTSGVGRGQKARVEDYDDDEEGEDEMEKVSGKVRGDTTTDGNRERGSDRERQRPSRYYEVVRPDRDALGRIVVDVGRPRDRDRDRDRGVDRDRDRPAPVYIERERNRY